MMNLTVKENTAISKLQGRYWTDVSSKRYLSFNKTSSKGYKVTANIPANAMTFNYNISGVDQTGNIGLTKGEFEVKDKLTPSIVDHTKDNCTTGDNLTFMVNATDNINISSLQVGYRYDGEMVQKINLSHQNASLWKKQISIRSDFQGDLTYWIKAVDGQGNKNQSEIRNIPIVDDDPPHLYAENITFDKVNTGETLIFRINATDNINVSNLRLGYKYGEGDFTKANFSYHNTNLWIKEVSIRTDFLGTFSYRIKAIDEEGNINQGRVRNIKILDNITPDAISGVDKTIDEDTIVSFDASNTPDNGVIANYTWTIQNMDYYGKTVDHTFDQPGEYRVVLNVTDEGGNFDTDTVEVTVKDITDPTAKAGEDSTVQLGQLITFDGSNSSDNVAINNYEWQIEDDTVQGKEITHTFEEPGEFVVKLTVKDEAGNLDTDMINVTIEKSKYSYDRQDTDADGIPDKYEKSHGLNPNDPADAKEDADGDGYSNVYEYQAGSDPFAKSEKPEESNLSIFLIPTLILFGILIYHFSKNKNKEKNTKKDSPEKSKENYQELERK